MFCQFQTCYSLVKFRNFSNALSIIRNSLLNMIILSILKIFFEWNNHPIDMIFRKLIPRTSQNVISHAFLFTRPKMSLRRNKILYTDKKVLKKIWRKFIWFSFFHVFFNNYCPSFSSALTYKKWPSVLLWKSTCGPYASFLTSVTIQFNWEGCVTNSLQLSVDYHTGVQYIFFIFMVFSIS